MTIYSKVAGVWKTIDDPQVKVSGVWKDVQTAYVKVSGVWKEIYNRVVVAITNQIVSFSTGPGTNAYARYGLDSDGKVYKYEGSSATLPNTFIENWVVPNSEASNYECYVTSLGDALQVGSSATGTWLALSTDRWWGLFQPSVGSDFKSAALAVTIRKIGTTTNLTSATISLSASNV